MHTSLAKHFEYYEKLLPLCKTYVAQNNVHQQYDKLPPLSWPYRDLWHPLTSFSVVQLFSVAKVVTLYVCRDEFRIRPAYAEGWSAPRPWAGLAAALAIKQDGHVSSCGLFLSWCHLPHHTPYNPAYVEVQSLASRYESAGLGLHPSRVSRRATPSTVHPLFQ